jgi:uncharacterized repeat protein (TIGR01451 family)
MNAQRIVFCFVLMLTLAAFSVKAQGALVTVKIIINGLGTGSVTSVPPGTVDCSSSCSVQIPTGTKLTLHAENGAGVIPRSPMWTGACAGFDDCNLNLSSAEQTVTATFYPAIAKLTLSVGAGARKIIVSFGSGISLKVDCIKDSSNCLQTLPKGTLVHLRAVWDSDHPFVGWRSTVNGNNPCLNSGAECDFTLNEFINLSADFSSVVPVSRISVSMAGSTGAEGGRIFSLEPAGAINCPPICTTTLIANQGIKLLAVPDANSVLDSWSLNSLACMGLTCDVPAGVSGEVRASFKLNPILGSSERGLTLRTSPPDAGHFEVNPKPDCTNTGCINYTSLSPVILEVLENPGYHFVGWTSASGFPCVSTTTSCGLYLRSSYDLTANFVTIASISAEVQLSLQAPSSVAPLEEFTLTATVHNAGPIEASNLSIFITLPGGVNFVSSSSNALGCQSWAFCTVTGLSNEAPDADLTISLRVRAPSNPGVLQWEASLGSATPDPVSANNIAKTTTQVGGTPPSLSVTKSANSPADGTVLLGASQVPMLAFKLTPSDTSAFELKSLKLKTSGTGNDNKDLLKVQLYQDTNQNALIDAGEPMLSSSIFETDDGTLSLNINPASSIASAGSSYVISANINTSLAAGHFSSLGLGFAGLMLLSLKRRKWRGLALGLLLSGALVSCPETPNQALRTFQISLTEASVTASSQTIAVTGLPLTGATISVAK